MEKFLFLLIFTSNFFILSAQTSSYKCSNLGRNKIEWKTTQGSKPLQYQGRSVFISKNELLQNGQLVFSFYTYKFDNKLYILDGSNTKLNYNKDDVLFSLPQPQEARLSIQNVMEDATLMLVKFITVNGNTFYTYEVFSKQKDINISKIIFDNKFNISEVVLTDNTNNCSCTRPDIKIQLR